MANRADRHPPLDRDRLVGAVPPALELLRDEVVQLAGRIGAPLLPLDPGHEPAVGGVGRNVAAVQVEHALEERLAALSAQGEVPVFDLVADHPRDEQDPQRRHDEPGSHRGLPQRARPGPEADRDPQHHCNAHRLDVGARRERDPRRNHQPVVRPLGGRAEHEQGAAGEHARAEEKIGLQRVLQPQHDRRHRREQGRRDPGGAPEPARAEAEERKHDTHPDQMLKRHDGGCAAAGKRTHHFDEQGIAGHAVVRVEVAVREPVGQLQVLGGVARIGDLAADGDQRQPHRQGQTAQQEEPTSVGEAGERAARATPWCQGLRHRPSLWRGCPSGCRPDRATRGTGSEARRAPPDTTSTANQYSTDLSTLMCPAPVGSPPA